MQYRYIDALRGIAILMVIIVHTGQYGAHLPVLFKSLTELGAKGVELFFMASAFTLFLTYEIHRSKEQFVNSNFFIRRFFRIAPMYYLGILYFSYMNGFHSIGVFISNFLFLHGLNPSWINDLVPGGWSITVEMTFYATLPFFVSKIKNLNLALKYTLIILLLSFILNFVLIGFFLPNSKASQEFLYYYFPNQLPVFCLGIVAYFIIIKQDFNIKKPAYLLLSTSILFIVMFMMHLKYSIPFPYHFVISLVFLGFIFVLAKKKYKIFVNDFMCYLGKISFSAYLIHFAILQLMFRYKFVDFIRINNEYPPMLNFGIRLIFIIFLVVLICSITYRFIETPFINIGKQIIKMHEGKMLKKVEN